MIENFKLSTNFSFEEAYRTSHADLLGENAKYARENLDKLVIVANVQEVIRTHYKTKITPTSWVRCLELNGRVSKSVGSYHKQCLAVDFIVEGYEDEAGIIEVINWIRTKSGLPFGKIINEQYWDIKEKKMKRWIHYSCGEPYRPAAQCRQVFLYRDGKYTKVN